MLQNASITAFTISELLRETQQRVKLPLSPTILGLKYKSDIVFLVFISLDKI